MKTLVAGIVAVLLVGALAGCTPAAATTPPTTPPTTLAAEPRPTPTSAPAPAVAVPTAPLAAFGGDCSVVATEEEVSAATGGPVVASPYSGTYMPDWTVRGLGGIRCAWTAQSGDGVWVTVIPIAAAGQDIVDHSGADQPYCYGGDSGAGFQDACSFSASVDGWWYAGVVYSAIDSGIAATDAVDALVADFGTRSSAHAATPPAATDGAWTETPSCEVLDERVRTDPLGVDLEAASGNSPGEAGPGFYGAMSAAGQETCFWESGTETLAETGILPGGWWVVDSAATTPGAESVTLPGATRAIRVPDADGSGGVMVYVTDGANLVTARGSLDADQLGALAAGVLGGVAG